MWGDHIIAAVILIIDLKGKLFQRSLESKVNGLHPCQLGSVIFNQYLDFRNSSFYFLNLKLSSAANILYLPFYLFNLNLESFYFFFNSFQIV